MQDAGHLSLNCSPVFPRTPSCLICLNKLSEQVNQTSSLVKGNCLEDLLKGCSCWMGC